MTLKSLFFLFSFPCFSCLGSVLNYVTDVSQFSWTTKYFIIFISYSSFFLPPKSLDNFKTKKISPSIRHHRDCLVTLLASGGAHHAHVVTSRTSRPGLRFDFESPEFFFQVWFAVLTTATSSSPSTTIATWVNFKQQIEQIVNDSFDLVQNKS
jgi:hypothetical protein